MIVDTNVLIIAFDRAHPRHDAYVDLLFTLADDAALFINEVIFAEISGRFPDHEAVRAAVAALDIRIQRLGLDECYDAGLAFREYRRRKGSRDAILPDFLIGAQAQRKGWPLVTSDRKGFASYFPDIDLIDPEQRLHD